MPEPRQGSTESSRTSVTKTPRHSNKSSGPRETCGLTRSPITTTASPSRATTGVGLTSTTTTQSSTTATPSCHRTPRPRLAPPRSPASPSGETALEEVPFSMEVYRSLHQRHFHSTHEELTFLRHAFVSSRRTLTLLHKETQRLEALLRARTRELDAARAEVEALRRRYEQPTLEVDAGPHHPTSPPDRSIEKAERTKASTGLALFAPGERGAGAAGAAGPLLQELRRNLARRDTALEQAALELGELKRVKAILAADLASQTRATEAAKAEAEKQRVALVTESSRATQLSRQLAEAQAEVEGQSQELARLRDAVDRAELLRGFYTRPGAAAAGSPNDAPAHDGGKAATETDYLFAQVRAYREKWQRAEDRVEELRRDLAEARRLARAESTRETAAAAIPLATAQRRRYESEIREQLDVIDRLQRQLARAEERGSFMSTEHNRLRVEAERAAAEEIEKLRATLSDARAALAVANEQRDALLRERDAVPVAIASREQTQLLRQRQCELSSELAEANARVGQLEKEVGGHVGERLRLQRENVELHAALQQIAAQEAIARAEVDQLRQRIGRSEGRVYALERLLGPNADGVLPPSPTATNRLELNPGHNASCTPVEAKDETRALLEEKRSESDDEEVDKPPAAMGSCEELLKLNASLRCRLNQMATELGTASATLHETATPPRPGYQLFPAQGTSPPSDVEQVQLSRASPRILAPCPAELRKLLSGLEHELGRLWRELRHSWQLYHTLRTRCRQLQQEREELLEDNVLLANGTERLYQELIVLRRSRERRVAKERVRAAATAGEHRHLHHSPR